MHTKRHAQQSAGTCFVCLESPSDHLLISIHQGRIQLQPKLSCPTAARCGASQAACLQSMSPRPAGARALCQSRAGDPHVALMHMGQPELASGCFRQGQRILWV